MVEIPYDRINISGRIDEARKMVDSLFPQGNGFSKRYVLKTLDILKDYYIQSSCQKVNNVG